MKTVRVELAERSYEIIVGSNMWENLPAALKEVLRPGKVLLVSDENVFSLYGQRAIGILQEAGFQVFPAVIPPGEGSKTLYWANELYTAAIRAGLDRKAAFIALGGGVVGDLAGFAAATYLRGVDFVQIPTTLLAQVDSSVGGKVAVNHELGKNLVGAFYQPKLVWIELETLTTLPRREFLAGAAEVVKYGAALDLSLLERLEKNWPAFWEKDASFLAEVITACCRIKAEIVSQDEKEKGIRALLNFGHTVGHALEAATSYRYYLHGEAVLIGMAAAVQLALLLELLKPDEARRLLGFFARIGLKEAPAGLTASEVLAALKQDKKRSGKKSIFVLPVGPGRAGIFDNVTRSMVAAVLDRYLHEKGQGLLSLDV